MRAYLIFPLLGALIVSPAHAELRTEVIIVVPADFSSPRAVSRLRQRISGAIEDVCGSYATTEKYQWDEIDVCRRDAWRRSEQRLASIHHGGEIRLSGR